VWVYLCCWPQPSRGWLAGFTEYANETVIASVTKSNMNTVKAECSACDGTGLYCGMCEATGTAVICIRCGGTGCEEISYKPFEGRKGRRGIQSVKWSRGGFIVTGVGGVGKSITYREFAAGQFPPK